jgi:hypothetical protein
MSTPPTSHSKGHTPSPANHLLAVTAGTIRQCATCTTWCITYTAAAVLLTPPPPAWSTSAAKHCDLETKQRR